MLVTEAIDQYLEGRRTRVSTNTWRGDRVALEKIKDFLPAVEITEVTDEDMDEFFTALGQAPSTKNVYLARTKQFFSYAQRRGWIDRDPTTERGRFRETEPDRLFVPRNRFPDLLAAASSPRDRAIVALGLYLFLRAGEIRTLRLADWNPNTGTVFTVQHKTDGHDHMPVCSELETELRAYRLWYAEILAARGESPGPRDYLIPSIRALAQPAPYPAYGRFTTTRIYRLLPATPVAHPERAIQRSLVSCGFPGYRQGGHTLRRSGARALFDTLRAEEGHDGALQQVKVMLHHQSAAMTERYLGIEPERERRNERLLGRPMFPAAPANLIRMRG